jgi:DNA-directed RNA polymerase specialized sigma24 family protein
MVDETSRYVGLAGRGDQSAIAWVVEHFTPLLLVRAGGFGGAAGGQVRDPRDVVAETWLIALPRLSGLTPRCGRLTPVLVRFLMTILDRCMLRAARRGREAAGGFPNDRETVCPAVSPAVLDGIIRSESVTRVLNAVDELAEPDRTIVLRRILDGEPPELVGANFGLSANAVSIRFSRALQQLRSRLGASLFDDF